MAKKATDKVLDVGLEVEIHPVVIKFSIIGTTPLIMNRLSEKARRELLLPPLAKNRAERAISLKHEPLSEFQRSMYRVRENDAPTRLVLPGGAFKKCIASAAVDLPGATKAQMGRLTSIPAVNVHIYGIPQVHCAIVRQAGINKTPDVRTRAILPRWACYLEVRFMAPLLKESNVAKLLVAAGAIVGVGDWRSEKGAGDYGSFSVVSPEDTDFLRIVESGGIAEQDEAIRDPIPYDYETEELLSWFDEELARRDQTSHKSNGLSAVVEDDGEEEYNDD